MATNQAALTDIAHLSAQQIGFSYGDKQVLNNLDVVIPVAKVTVIVGPNGCGKSTLLSMLAATQVPDQGDVILNGDNIHLLDPKKRATYLALLPQSAHAPQGLTVQELVMRGRYAHQHWFFGATAYDQQVVESAIAQTDLSAHAADSLEQLSGGLRQRAWIAMVLAQQTPILLLDEPTTYLDIAHQLDVLSLCQRLNQEEATTIVMVLHDLNQAIRFADNLIVMKSGDIVAQGAPSEIMDAALLRNVFGLDAVIEHDKYNHCPFIIPINSQSTQK